MTLDFVGAWRIRILFRSVDAMLRHSAGQDANLQGMLRQRRIESPIYVYLDAARRGRKRDSELLADWCATYLLDLVIAVTADELLEFRRLRLRTSGERAAAGGELEL